MEVIPEDVVRQCLLKMPYASHDTLKAVCNSWEAILSSPTFYADRKKCGMSEQLICLIQEDMTRIEDMYPAFVLTVYDPVKGTWERLPPIDDPPNTQIPLGCQCVAVNRKLLLIGGFRPSNGSVNSVYIYDFESARWRRGADMPTRRSIFACSVSSSTGLVYVAGGMGEHDISLAAAEAYDAEKDKWEILPPMIEPHGQGCQGVFVEGKFMVIDDQSEIFDPSEGTWTMNVRDLWRTCVFSSSSGELYAFTEEQLVKYDVDKDVWSGVASLPNPDIAFFECATQWRDQFFVSGVRYQSENHISYLFNPSTRQLIEVNDDGGEGFAGMIVSAATVEI